MKVAGAPEQLPLVASSFIEKFKREYRTSRRKIYFAKGKAEEILPLLAEKFNADTLYFGRTYDPAGIATQNLVESSFVKDSITVESFNTSLLQNPGK